jgi:hypothetical protein
MVVILEIGLHADRGPDHKSALPFRKESSSTPYTRIASAAHLRAVYTQKLKRDTRYVHSGKPAAECSAYVQSYRYMARSYPRAASWSGQLQAGIARFTVNQYQNE